MSKKNSYPKVVAKPGGKTGGTSTTPKVVKSPTKYTGGKNSPARVSPTKKGK